ncbi:hypothetical protein JNB63_13615 [Microbacterium trichothecenolyticum]|uniref:Membrane protein involved in the export of O-antigen and teichoic acid n=1 Tax=Microbacterium ureisolvens TaxID=2781186 RepID=A0ABS7I1V6_9MICO|nr:MULTISPECIES: hypothetical protein [Microbacterium]MBW9111641.1 hypothetical protein [Microbacterium ureisolvens]MBW9121132.1 hypothetical protein [Microbacterium trichothecenolyticum]
MTPRRLRLPRPLTIAQILSSAAGAVPMLIAAVRMDPPAFTSFSILTLASVLAVGGSRAALFQPALIFQRTDAGSLVPARYMLVVSSLSALAVAAIAVVSTGAPPAEAGLIGVAGAVPVFYDWVRYRAIGSGRRWAVAAGDGVRLTFVSATALPLLAATPLSFMLAIGVSCAIAAAVLLPQVPVRVGTYPYRRYRSSAAWQTLDFAVGQAIVSLPLFLLAGSGANDLIGGVRLAQTLLGPLNLAFAATTTNIIADGATHVDYRQASAVIARGWRASIRLGLLATAVVTILTGVIWSTGWAPAGVERADLLLGMVLVGASTILTGWSGIHGIVLRVLDHQSAVTLVRIGIASATTAGFLIGYAAGGDEWSLILGFGANAISAPLLFIPVALFHYRRDTRETP